MKINSINTNNTNQKLKIILNKFIKVLVFIYRICFI
jgi:hypothetical protein